VEIAGEVGRRVTGACTDLAGGEVKGGNFGRGSLLGLLQAYGVDLVSFAVPPPRVVFWCKMLWALLLVLVVSLVYESARGEVQLLQCEAPEQTDGVGPMRKGTECGKNLKKNLRIQEKEHEIPYELDILAPAGKR